MGNSAPTFLILSLELINEVVNKTVVEIFATKVSVTGGRLDLEDTLLDGQERHIESAATQVEDEHVALTLMLLVQTVGDGGSGRLVDDTEDVQTGNETGVLGGLPLRVVEVCWHGNDSVVDGATEVCLRGLPHLGKDHGGNLLGGEVLGLALEVDLNDRLAGLLDDLEWEVLHVGLHLGVTELAADQTLGVEDGVVRVHSDLVLCGITDQTLGVGEGNERGRGAVALVVGDDLNAVISEDTHTGVGGTQVDTDCWGHDERFF